MDPVSAGSMVLEIVGILKQLYDYGQQVQSARTDITQLCSELSALRSVLTDIDARQGAVSSQQCPSHILAMAKAVLEVLAQRLKPKDSAYKRKLQALTWPFDKSGVMETLTNLERVKTTLLLQLMGDQQGALDSVAEIRHDMRAVKGILQHSVATLHDKEQSERYQKTADCLSPTSPYDIHQRICVTWQGSSSGSWFLNGPYRAWIDSAESDSRVLAVCGVSGAGKSTLMSRVIDHQQASNPDNFTAFFYCSYNEIATHEERNILGSLLVQMSANHPSVLDPFSRYVSVKDLVPITALHDAILHFANTVKPILLVIDAVNELRQPDAIMTRVASLVLQSENVRCLFSSTTPFAETHLTKMGCPSIRVDMSAQNIEPDIEEYVRKQVRNHEVLKVVGEDKIVAAIAPKAEGMFRWAACQVDILTQQLTAKRVERALERLPGTLDEIYVELLRRVPGSAQTFVREALMWLSFSFRKLSLEELTEAIVIEIGDESIDDSYRLQPLSRILELCQGLIEWDERTDIVSLAHGSVRTFLQSQYVRESSVKYFSLDWQEATGLIIRKSLSYMLMNEFESGAVSLQKLAQLHRQYPLLEYASCMWAVHGCDYANVTGGLGEEEVQLVLQLFRSHRKYRTGGQFASWVRCLLPYSEASVAITSTPLYYAASFGLAPIVRLLLEQGEVDLKNPRAAWYIDRKCGRYASTALQVASYRGHVDVVAILLEYGADPDSLDDQAISCVQWACILGYFHIVAMLRTKSNRGHICDRCSEKRIGDIGAYTPSEIGLNAAESQSGSVLELPYMGMSGLRRFLQT